MNFPPPSTERFHIEHQAVRDFRQRLARKPIIFPQYWRAIRAVQVENSFAAISNYVDMNWAMVVGIDDHPQAENNQHCRHYSENPISFGLTNAIKPIVVRVSAGADAVDQWNCVDSG
jgi:hypothetical protein